MSWLHQPVLNATRILEMFNIFIVDAAAFQYVKRHNQIMQKCVELFDNAFMQTSGKSLFEYADMLAPNII